MNAELQWLVSKCTPMIDSDNRPIPASGFFQGRLPARMVKTFKTYLNTDAGAIHRTTPRQSVYNWSIGNVHYTAKFGVYFSTQDSITLTYETYETELV